MSSKAIQKHPLYLLFIVISLYHHIISDADTFPLSSKCESIFAVLRCGLNFILNFWCLHSGFPYHHFKMFIKTGELNPHSWLFSNCILSQVCLLSLTHHAGSAGGAGWDRAECRQDGGCFSLRHCFQPSKWGRDQRATGAFASVRPHPTASKREEEWWVNSTQIMLLSVSLPVCLFPFFPLCTFWYILNYFVI